MFGALGLNSYSCGLFRAILAGYSGARRAILVWRAGARRGWEGGGGGGYSPGHVSPHLVLVPAGGGVAVPEHGRHVLRRRRHTTRTHQAAGA